MKVLTFIFIKVPRKIFRIIFYKWEHLYYPFFYSKPKLNLNLTRKRYLIAGSDDFDKIAQAYRKLFLDKVQTKITEADLICEHIFDILGSGPKSLGPKGKNYQLIDWHSDFKSGHRWNPKTFYRDIHYGHIEGVDIKVPWELSRFQHLNILGQAYILTKDKKYSEEFANQINDWIKNNPVGFGVNWKCTMDVAIRAANWLVAMEYFSNKGVLSQYFLNKFYGSIYEHGKFIRSHLEYSSKLTTNHYLADLVGLFFIAVYCPFFKESNEWHDFCVKELAREIQKQVYDDGCDFEASTSYHRLTLEMFFYCELIGKRAGVEFPQPYQDKVHKMFEFSLYCIKPDGKIPQIGDNDNGRYQIFSFRPVLEHKYLLSLAAIYYGDSEFKLSEFNFDEEAFWVFGAQGHTVFEQLPARTEPLKSRAFPNAGWFIMRHNDNYCFVSCGPNGQNSNGGHAHNDKLSFELMLDGQDIIVDPGTYVYTSYPEERNKFRSTAYHNTVKFNDYEQNEISKRNVFNLPDRVKIKKANLKEEGDKITFQGEVQYLDFTHKRAIILDKEFGNWQIVDNVFCSNPVNGKLIFHLPPEVFCKNGYIFSKKTSRKIASIKIERYKFQKGKYDYSPEYGIKVEAKYLVANMFVTKEIMSINTHINRCV